MSKTAWKLNIWTGDHLLDLPAKNERILRLFGGGLYRAEFWGDYSLDFPKYGPWRKTLPKAKRDLPALRAEGAAEKTPRGSCGGVS